ncbi:MAG: Y-family DNA polymerase, partial [Candidatus Zixiibacteriota bacterium]
MPSMSYDFAQASPPETARECRPQTLFALVDCDNFYVSCERVFNPRLRDRPVVALSNNDGCIISRSREAKALGVKMGAPLHHVTAEIHRHNIAVLSSNYALYGDMSARVLETLRQFTPDIEVYSIDEAFLRLSAPPRGTFDELARDIRRTVGRWTGVPVSIGLGQTKTLAKVAVEVAKKSGGVFNIASFPNPETVLRETPVGDIWGIGKRYRIWLESLGVDTALALRDLDDEVIRRRAGIVGLRTVWELRGRSCLPLTALVPARKGITASRSFGRPVRDYKLLREAVASYAARAGVKLRRDSSVAGFLTVFLMTNRFSDETQYSKSAVVPLVPASDSDCDLIRAATSG